MSKYPSEAALMILRYLLPGIIVQIHTGDVSEDVCSHSYRCQVSGRIEVILQGEGYNRRHPGAELCQAQHSLSWKNATLSIFWLETLFSLDAASLCLLHMQPVSCFKDEPGKVCTFCCCRLQLQLSWADLALFSLYTPTQPHSHTPGHPTSRRKVANGLQHASKQCKQISKK